MSLIDFNELKEKGLRIEFESPLSFYTTFQLGGACPTLIFCETSTQLQQAVQFLKNKKCDFILIGGGSNIVVSDKGIDCVVIRYVSSAPRIQRDCDDLIVSASTLLDDLAKFAAAQALEGLNYATGIPGTVGGAIVGNAGAFGKQVGDVLKSVTLIDRKTGDVKEVLPGDLQFTYRNSILKETGDFVVSAVFSMQSGNKESLHKEREEILSVRASKHPDLSTHPCAGSFFRNIEPTSK